MRYRYCEAHHLTHAEVNDPDCRWTETLSTLPRDLKEGDEVFAWVPSLTSNRMVWRFVTVKAVDKKPGHRSGYVPDPRFGKVHRDAKPTEYHVRYEGIPGRRVLTPSTHLDVRVPAIGKEVAR
jgi:hypothetical protein